MKTICKLIPSDVYIFGGAAMNSKNFVSHACYLYFVNSQPYQSLTNYNVLSCPLKKACGCQYLNFLSHALKISTGWQVRLNNELLSSTSCKCKIPCDNMLPMYSMQRKDSLIDLLFF